ncbi:MAG: replication-associated recombination protein A [Clostridia bacterium]|nr:replication-associated recombination protein A [Clostridia bacterium]
MDNLEQSKRIPLAERMRPTTFEDFFGQEHLSKKGCFIRRAVEAGTLGSAIFFGPPGTGKTTLANIISNLDNGIFKKLNAVTSGVSDAKKIIDDARKDKSLFARQTYLLLDECHRWSKAQSDCILAAVEDGTIVFIGTTTENPYYSMTPAIVSRCKVFEFKPLEKADIIKALKNAISSEKGLKNFNVKITDEALNHIAWASGGDLRNAYGSLELAALTTPPTDGEVIIDIKVAEDCTQSKALSIDENTYYDYLSAFCKSIRGSDPDAALFYSERLIGAGVAPEVINRRLIAHCSEDIGLADSNALLLATASLYAIKNLGVPEGLLNLTHAIIYACTAEKSNSVVVAMNKARDAAKKYADLKAPFHLRNHPSTNDTKKIKYKYPHDYGGWVKQQYMPDGITDLKFYTPSENGKEKNIKIKKENKI